MLRVGWGGVGGVEGGWEGRGGEGRDCECPASQMFSSHDKRHPSSRACGEVFSFKDNICMEMVARVMQCDSCYVNWRIFPSP